MTFTTPKDLHKAVLLALKEKQPLLAVRAGDGEAITLNGFNDKEKLDYVMNRQLGHVPPPSDISIIQMHLKRAYQVADYIGIPEHKREGLNEYWYKVREILEDSILVQGKYTSVDFHNDWLSAGLFDGLLKDRETLVYISCRNLDNELKARYNIKNIYSYIIAPEMKFTPDYKGLRHYPEQIGLVKEWVKTVPAAGNLCLYGAGVVGKVYGAWFKRSGGVAVDIGNVFDAFAGLVTRGKNKGVGVTDNTYKL